MEFPEKYKWMLSVGSPRYLVEAFKYYGMTEIVGKGSNSTIMAMAKYIGVIEWYTDDDIPWCAIPPGFFLKKDGYAVPSPGAILAAKSFLTFGKKIEKGLECYGHILIFARPGGNHVCWYVGENEHAFLCYGGNQSNKMGFAWIDKARLIGCREPIWKIGKPDSVKKIYLTETGELSKNEQ